MLQKIDTVDKDNDTILQINIIFSIFCKYIGIFLITYYLQLALSAQVPTADAFEIRQEPSSDSCSALRTHNTLDILIHSCQLKSKNHAGACLPILPNSIK